MARARLPVLGFHGARTLDNFEEDHRIGLEINAGKLYQLLVCGAVSVADFCCLDHASKSRVRILCLHACAHCLSDGVSPAKTGWRRPRKSQP